jgi:rare lipoprotein A
MVKTVRINDRGPFLRGRVIDLNPVEASQLGFSNLAPVDLTVLSTPVKSALPR